MKEHIKHSSQQLKRSLVQFSNYFMTGSWCELFITQICQLVYES